MNDWYQRMVASVQLNGKGERTQQAYTRAVRMLSEFYSKTPDDLDGKRLELLKEAFPKIARVAFLWGDRVVREET